MIGLSRPPAPELRALQDSQDRPRLGADGIARRHFLQRGATAALAVGALGVTGIEAVAASGQAQVRRRVAIGKTGLLMPDISMGTGSTRDPAIIRYAYERGMTYFDTAEGYPMKSPGLAEKGIAKALREVGAPRDGVVLASKQVARAHEKRVVMMRRLERSLRRLQTDYVDIYFNHAVNEVARMQNAEWHEFTALAVKQGKIRFHGMSGHGGHLIECLEYSIANDLVDVILVGYNFGQDPAFYEKFTRSFDIVANQEGLPAVLSKAHAKGIGVIAMKTLMGARLNDMRPFEKASGTFAQSAFRWVLSNPHVSGLIVSMKTREVIDEYLAASGTGAPKQADLRLLEGYEAKNGSTQCRQGCGACASSCPYGVPIEDVLRARMYARDYEDRDGALVSYAKLGAGASPCLACSGEPCATACPYGLDIPRLTRDAAKRLGG